MKISKGVFAMDHVEKRFAATDGWVKMPDGTNHYIFGFNDVTNIPKDGMVAQRGKATLLAPLLEAYEGDEVKLTLKDLGMTKSQGVDDKHTIYWEGFPNEIILGSGVTAASRSIPGGRDFHYNYKVTAPGTYVYHCYFETVEHLQMGMVGPLIVRPILEKDPNYCGRKFVYNDTATEFDWEALIFLTELDGRANDLSGNDQKFTGMDGSLHYWLMNGRSYPDTVKHGNDPELPLQPFSSRIDVYEGEKVLLRFVNLGFQDHCMQLLGIPLQLVGQDARKILSCDRDDSACWRNSVNIARGQTVDAVFTAPAPGKYILYNRGHHKNTNGGISFGGMITEVNVLEP